MAPKKEKNLVANSSSKIWEPSLIAAHFNQVSQQPPKSSARARPQPQSELPANRRYSLSASQGKLSLLCTAFPRCFGSQNDLWSPEQECLINECSLKVGSEYLPANQGILKEGSPVPDGLEEVP